MNRNLLFIAIAAVAVVLVAIAILFVGNGQPPGSLSGAIGPTATTLTLNASTCSVPDRAGNVNFTLSGELRDPGGNPLAGRSISLRTFGCDNDACVMDPALEFVTTDQAGVFAFAKTEKATPNYDADTYRYYIAEFPGDAMGYAGAMSDRVRKRC